MLISELILYSHIAPLSYYCVLLCCLEQWVASFDGLWSFWQPATAYKHIIVLYAIYLFLQVVNTLSLSLSLSLSHYHHHHYHSHYRYLHQQQLECQNRTRRSATANRSRVIIRVTNVRFGQDKWRGQRC